VSGSQILCLLVGDLVATGGRVGMNVSHLAPLYFGGQLKGKKYIVNYVCGIL